MQDSVILGDRRKWQGGRNPAANSNVSASLLEHIGSAPVCRIPWFWEITGSGKADGILQLIPSFQRHFLSTLELHQYAGFRDSGKPQEVARKQEQGKTCEEPAASMLGKGGVVHLAKKTNLVVYGEKGNRRFWKGPKIRKRQGPSVWVWPSVRPSVWVWLSASPSRWCVRGSGSGSASGLALAVRRPGGCKIRSEIRSESGVWSIWRKKQIW